MASTFRSRVSQVCKLVTRAGVALLIMLAQVTLASLQARAQTLTILYSFKGGADGLAPTAGLTRDSLGNFFGTTINGGTFNEGIVFELDAAGNESVLHSFGPGDGELPRSSLLLDSAGSLYGTTTYGGSFGAGTVFKVDANGNETVLHSFTGADGQTPYGALIRDSAGNLYGTTSAGGAKGYGTVFRLSTSGVATVLHHFKGTPDGAVPLAALVADSLGNLYGTTSYGGTDNYGTVFELDGAGQETILHSFTGGADGLQPSSNLLLQSSNLYGTTFGAFHIWSGTVFKVTLSSQHRTLYKFSGGADGKGPTGGLIRDAAGNFYGTTNIGGAFGLGTVFMLNKDGMETVLHSFAQTNDGVTPFGSLRRDQNGNFYGTTETGGTFDNGTVYKLTP